MTVSVISTRPSTVRASSIGITASAPSGTTPPVEIAMASPDPSGRVAGAPAATLPASVRLTGAAAVSADRTRESVHRRAREGRQVDGRADRLGEDASVRPLDRDALRVQALGPLEDEALRFLDRDRLHPSQSSDRASSGAVASRAG